MAIRILLVLLLSSGIAACADSGGPSRPRPQITSCPVGMVLICESRQPPSKGGADEEIPQYERCHCEPQV